MSTANPLATTLITAAQNASVIDVVYDGKSKSFEVHAVGPNHARVMQVAGESSRPLPNWALIKLDKIESATFTSTPSLAPREGYRKGDKQISEILYEL
jgi:hypothetical protein